MSVKIRRKGLVIVLMIGALGLYLGLKFRRPAGPRHILLVTFDTTRADRLGVYGYRVGNRSPTPVLDGLANAGFSIRRAVTPVPLTLPAHASLLTGLQPPEHGLRENDAFRLVPRNQRDFETLAEILSARGRTTAAFVSSQVLSSSFGLDSGFDHYHDLDRRAAGGESALAEFTAKETADATIAWLNDVDPETSFVWVHFFDPHEPWVNHKTGWAGEIVRAGASDYVGEIAFADEQLGRILEHYRLQGWEDETLVVVTADHGEGLGEHGEETHGYLNYETTIHVPLIVRPPREFKFREPETVAARLTDVFSTILESVGVKFEHPGAQSLWRARADDQRWAYGESVYTYRQFGWSATFSWRDGRHKFVSDGHDPELYDLDVDPGETQNLADSHPEVVRALQEDMRVYRAGLKSRSHIDTRRSGMQEVDASSYLGGPSADIPAEPGPDEWGKLPSPRTRMGVIRNLDDLRLCLERGDRRGLSAADVAEIRRLIGVLQAADAEGPMTQFWVARAHLKLSGAKGVLDRVELRAAALASVQGFEKFLKVRKLDHRAWNQISAAHLRLFEETNNQTWLLDMLQRSKEQENRGLLDGLGFALRGQAYRRLGNLEAALGAFEQAVHLAPDRVSFRNDRDSLKQTLLPK